MFIHTPDMFQDVIDRRAIQVINDSMDFYVEYRVNFEMQKRIGNHVNCEIYNYDDVCWYKKYEREIRSATSDRCTIPWALNNTHICTSEENVQSALKALDSIVMERFHCPKSCLSMPLLVTGGVIEGPADKVSLKLRFSPWVSVSNEENLYTFLSMIAEIGGYVGLLCGYSMLTFVQWFYQAIKNRIHK